MATSTIRLLRRGFPDEPGMDIAISRAMLLETSDGANGESFRIHVPGRVVAFGKHDTLTDGFAAAATAAMSMGFSAEERLAGGRAAVFHEGTLSFSWTTPDPDPISRVQERFETVADLVVRSFSRLGIDSAVGEVPGEYCPGRYSVHHDHRIKLMGVGQRLARRAAHIGGVIVVNDAALVNRALTPVYAALDTAFDPAVTGALTDIDATVTIDSVVEAVVAELGRMADVVEDDIRSGTIDIARSLAAEHLASAGAAPATTRL